jgi:hypothetical protein
MLTVRLLNVNYRSSARCDPHIMSKIVALSIYNNFIASLRPLICNQRGWLSLRCMLIDRSVSFVVSKYWKLINYLHSSLPQKTSLFILRVSMTFSKCLLCTESLKYLECDLWTNICTILVAWLEIVPNIGSRVSLRFPSFKWMCFWSRTPNLLSHLSFKAQLCCPCELWLWYLTRFDLFQSMPVFRQNHLQITFKQSNQWQWSSTSVLQRTLWLMLWPAVMWWSNADCSFGECSNISEYFAILISFSPLFRLTCRHSALSPALPVSPSIQSQSSQSRSAVAVAVLLDIAPSASILRVKWGDDRPGEQHSVAFQVVFWLVLCHVRCACVLLDELIAVLWLLGSTQFIVALRLLLFLIIPRPSPSTLHPTGISTHSESSISRVARSGHGLCGLLQTSAWRRAIMCGSSNSKRWGEVVIIYCDNDNVYYYFWRTFAACLCLLSTIVNEGGGVFLCCWVVWCVWCVS